MSLNMQGHIDSVFTSGEVVFLVKTNGGWTPYGDPIEPAIERVPYVLANVQPLRDRELQNLLMAGKRVGDTRKIYVNTGDLAKLTLATGVEFEGQLWEIIESDIRPMRMYAKVVVSRYDNQ